MKCHLLGLALCLPPAVFGSDEAALRVASQRVAGLDPAQAASVAAAVPVGLLFETLLEYEPHIRPYRLRPGLAEALPEISPDGLTFSLRLRADARFTPDPCFGQDASGHPVGRAVTAWDVAYSLMRLADAREASPGAWTVVDRIEGMAGFRERSRNMTSSAEPGEVSGLRVRDDRHLEIRLTGPAPFWSYVLAMPYTAVVPREAVAAYGTAFSAHPVGSGPYRLESWRRHYRLTLVRNRDWPGWAAALTAPVERMLTPYERIHFLVIDDPATQWMSFLAGELDLHGQVGRDYWEAVVDGDGRLQASLAARGIRLQTLEALDVAYLGFNFDDPIVGPNRALRQAIQSAFDAEAWEQFHQRRVTRATGPVPPGVAGRIASPMPYGFNLERARRLMIEAGYPGGIDASTGRRLELTLDVGRTDTEMRESIELLAAFVERIGIVLRPRYSHWPAFLGRVSRREAQMFRLKWIADYPDAENFLQLFYSPNASPGPNRANYRNPDYDRLYREAVVEVDPERRLARYRDLQAILLEDLPWLFLHHRITASLSHASLHGFQPHGFPYGMEKYYRQARPRNPVRALAGDDPELHLQEPP